MMMKNEGTFAAKVVDHDLEVDSQMNLKQVMVRFDVIDTDGSTKQITWYGSFKPLQPGKQTSATEITLKTLAILGFKGTKPVDLMALSRVQPGTDELKPLALDGEKLVDLVLANDTYNGKTTLKVKFINEQGRGAMKRMDVAAPGMINFGGLDIESNLAEIASKRGTTTAAPTVKAPF